MPLEQITKSINEIAAKNNVEAVDGSAVEERAEQVAGGDVAASDEKLETSQVASEAGEGSAAATETPKEETWTPNYKLKVLDEEKEIEEWARGLITKENEEQVRALFSKAYGLDSVKPKLDAEREARENITQSFKEFAGEVQQIIKLRDTDLDAFFAEVNLTEDKILAWAIQKAQAREATKDLPDGLKNIYTEFGTLKRKNSELERTIKQLSNSAETSSVQTRTQELRQELSNPDYAPLIAEWEDRVGKPGAFQRLVIRHGQAEFAETGQDIPAKQAVSDVLNYLGLTRALTDAKPNDSATSPAKKVITAPKPTVIPNTGAGAGSATAPKYKSVADLRKRAKELNG